MRTHTLPHDNTSWSIVHIASANERFTRMQKHRSSRRSLRCRRTEGRTDIEMYIDIEMSTDRRIRRNEVGVSHRAHISCTYAGRQTCGKCVFLTNSEHISPYADVYVYYEYFSHILNVSPLPCRHCPGNSETAKFHSCRRPKRYDMNEDLWGFMGIYGSFCTCGEMWILTYLNSPYTCPHE